MNTYQKYKPAWLQLVIFMSLTIGIFFALSFIAVFTIAKAYNLTPLQLTNPELSDPVVVSATKLVQAVSTVVFFLVPSLVFAYLSDRKPLQYAGFKQPAPWIYYLIGILVILACFPMVSWLGDINDRIHLPQAMQETEKMLRNVEAKQNDYLRKILIMESPVDLVNMLVVLALLPAVAEELFFRGILQRIFIQMTRRPWIGIIITSILFSALHGQFLGFLPRMVLGIVLGALYWYSGSLYPGMVAHFLNNAVQIILVYLSPEFLDKDIRFGAGIIAGSTLVVIALTWWMSRITQTTYAEVYDTDDDFHIGPRDQYSA
jgi:uncharacterized protein